MNKSSKIQHVRLKRQPIKAVLFAHTPLALPGFLAGRETWKLLTSSPERKGKEAKARLRSWLLISGWQGVDQSGLGWDVDNEKVYAQQWNGCWTCLCS